MELSYSNRLQVLEDNELYSTNGGEAVVGACIVAGLVIIGLICLAGYLAGKKQAENEIRAGKWD